MSNSQVKKMQILFIIAGFYTLKWFGTCSEIPTLKISDKALFDATTSENFEDKEQIYLETTENSINQNPSKSYAGDFVKPEPLVSDPLFENTDLNTSQDMRVNRKRYIEETGLSHETEMQILQLHNLYRSNVTPSAGNMAYMEWDDELARLAQIWSDKCFFEHGMPDNDYPETIGQNLYIGSDPTGYLGLYFWYEEYHHYDLRKEYCIPGKQCGHYVQMAWSASRKLGCGMTKCGMRFLLTCHYSPSALRGVPMYRVANSCSQCPPVEGTLCLRNLCITPEQCKNKPFDCLFAKCDLECQNCGRLDKEKCSCECADGWDSPDCSYLCSDKHKRCGKSPGWPNKASCSLNRQSVGEIYCRKMCEVCHSLNTSASNNICCGGKLCDDGYVLDPYENTCKCMLLCPGPLCDSEDAGQYQAALESRANCLGKFLYFERWIVVFALYFGIRNLRREF